MYNIKVCATHMDREYTQDTTIYAPCTSLFLYTLTPLQMSSLQVLLTNHQGCKYLYHRTEQQSPLPVCQAQYSSLQIHTLYQSQSIAAAQREQGISEYVGVCEQKKSDTNTNTLFYTDIFDTA